MPQAGVSIVASAHFPTFPWVDNRFIHLIFPTPQSPHCFFTISGKFVEPIPARISIPQDVSVTHGCCGDHSFHLFKSFVWVTVGPTEISGKKCPNTCLFAPFMSYMWWYKLINCNCYYGERKMQNEKARLFMHQVPARFLQGQADLQGFRQTTHNAEWPI